MESKNETVRIKKEQPNKYNESYAATLDNIYITAVLANKLYGRTGYQIKLLEQILAELKKMNGEKK